VLQGRYRSARTEIYQANTHCFEIIQVYDEVLVAVYDEPLPNAVLEKEHPPQSIASIQLGRFAPGAGSWAIGKPGRYEGWIALQGLGPDGKEKYDGAPWSTAALMKLGNEVVSKPGAAVVAAALHTAAAVTANATPAPSRP
jgi:hypothetical protein